MSRLLILLMMCSFLEMNAQQPVIESFAGVQSNDDIVLTFVSVKGNTCLDTEILRGADETNFNVIGTIPGLCGSTDTNVSYVWIDQAPIPNAINYYKINMRALGYSNVLAVKYVDYSSGSALVVHNNDMQVLTCYYKNPNRKAIAYAIYDINGELMTTGQNNNSEWTIDTSTWAEGIFIAHFTNGQNNTAKRFALMP